MKKLALICMVMAAVVFASGVSVCSAAKAFVWVKYKQIGDEAYYYDASNMFYLSDDIGPTPYIGVIIKIEKQGRVTTCAGFAVDPELNAWTATYDVIKRKEISSMRMPLGRDNFRLIEALKRWQQAHPQR